MTHAIMVVRRLGAEADSSRCEAEKRTGLLINKLSKVQKKGCAGHKGKMTKPSIIENDIKYDKNLSISMIGGKA